MPRPSATTQLRYRRDELEGLSVKELKALLPWGDHYRPVDNHDLINHLIDCGAVECVDRPKTSTRDVTKDFTTTPATRRRPRFDREELQGLSIKELKSLLPWGDNYQALDKDDLIHHLIVSGAVELVDRPPVESKMSDIRRMSISQLKKCMNEEAGVFFDSKKVFEKKDMIDLFLDSGMLCVLSESEDESFSDRRRRSLTNNGPSRKGINNENETLADKLRNSIRNKDGPRRTLKMRSSNNTSKVEAPGVKSDSASIDDNLDPIPIDELEHFEIDDDGYERDRDDRRSYSKPVVSKNTRRGNKRDKNYPDKEVIDATEAETEHSYRDVMIEEKVHHQHRKSDKKTKPSRRMTFFG